MRDFALAMGNLAMAMTEAMGHVGKTMAELKVALASPIAALLEVEGHMEDIKDCMVEKPRPHFRHTEHLVPMNPSSLRVQFDMADKVIARRCVMRED